MFLLESSLILTIKTLDVRKFLGGVMRALDGSQRRAAVVDCFTKDCAVLTCVLLYCLSKTAKVFYPAVPGWLSSLFFGLAVLLSCVAILEALSSSQAKGAVRIGVALIGVLAATLFAPLILQSVFLEDAIDRLGRSALGTATSLSLFAVAWMIVGATLEKAWAPSSNVLAIAIVGTVALLIFPNIGDDFVVNYRRLNTGRGDGIEFDHLTLGETVPVLILFAFAISQGVFKFIIVAVGVLILFVLGGRTALFALVPAIIGFFAFKRELARYVPLLLLVLFLPLLLAILNYGVLILDSAALSRMFIMNGLESESSYLARSDLFAVGVRALPDQILFGDPTFLVMRFGSVGAYIHGVLSAWQFWGFFAFATIVGCCATVMFVFWRRPALINDVIGSFVLVVFLFGVVCVLGGKHIGFDVFWLGLGMALSRLSFATQHEVC